MVDQEPLMRGSTPRAARPSNSRVWLSGARCSPARLPLAIAFTCRAAAYRMARMSPPKREDGAILALLFGSILAVCVALEVVTAVISSDPAERHWFGSLVFNLLGYSTVFLPGYLIIQYVKKSGYLERGPQKCMEPLVRLFVKGSEETIDDAIDEEAKQKERETAGHKSEFGKAVTLLVCFAGLQVSYLTWGVLQEKIMTRTYKDSMGNEGQFKDSQFLVFVNRILAFAIALLYITVSRQPRHRAPLYKYSYCSFSNIMSSWCQYEALKFISFPTQVLAKASKIIPVMIMGKIVSNKKYEYYEYVVAVLISLGMVLFLFGSQEDRGQQTNTTTLSGVVLLIGYMASDSFTSNWQNELFDSYKMTSVQMMCGVNLFSCLLTSASLLEQGTFYTSLVFMSQFPSFGFDCVVLSICSAVGQLFIYYTISEFGAVVFIIIMTLRQAMAIILSCFLYSHPVDATGVVGIFLVFGAMFLKIYCSHRLRKVKVAREKLLAKSGAGAMDVVATSGKAKEGEQHQAVQLHSPQIKA